jgi:hypothetical protein
MQKQLKLLSPVIGIQMKIKATTAEITRYQSIIGSLLYLMIGTRPDISYAVTHLS